MAESPAQRAARERNLRLGNPRSYSQPAEGAPEKPPRAAEGETTTFRARAPRAAAPKTPRKPRAAPRARPRAPEGDPPAAPREPKSGGGGFFGGLLDGLR